MSLSSAVVLSCDHQIREAGTTGNLTCLSTFAHVFSTRPARHVRVNPAGRQDARPGPRRRMSMPGRFGIRLTRPSPGPANERCRFPRSQPPRVPPEGRPRLPTPRPDMNAEGYRSPRAAPGGTTFLISARSSAVRCSSVAGRRLGRPLAGADQRHDVLAPCGHPGAHQPGDRLLHRQGPSRRRRRHRYPLQTHKGRKLGKRKKLYNRHHAKIRALGERGAATLKGWHILRRARRSPSRMAAIVQAILALCHQAR
ncbi:transposase family protein [Thermomonospora amylolytica]|uniref:transposase family protein n=1 Tax=Thermomonospora amylolytica TaxID=1411117 RepID=UPI00389B23BB